MRKAVTVLLAFAVVGIVGGPATAAPKHQERYQTRWVNAFWHSRARLDSRTYLRVTWYAGAYDTGESRFFSDLYRSVERCKRRDGRDRCRYAQRLSWYGYTSRRSGNTFTLDRRLSQGHLDATYRLYRSVRRHRVLVGRFHVVADLTGTGDLIRGRQSYTTQQGCTMFSYKGRYESRAATATGTLARGDKAARDLGETKDANFGANKTVEIEHTC
jgi:hypothetical protein